MTQRVQWEPTFAVGHEVVDAQHQALLAQCNLLADRCEGGTTGEHDPVFAQLVDRLKALVQEHFETESSLLADLGDPDLEDHRFEFDEFRHVTSEVATAENFERPELQRFLAVWCLGHVAGSADRQRALLAEGRAPA